MKARLILAGDNCDASSVALTIDSLVCNPAGPTQEVAVNIQQVPRLIRELQAAEREWRKARAE